MTPTTSSSPPLLREWSAEFSAKDGRKFDLRPASPEDEAALRRFFGRATPEDLRFRFLSALSSVDPRLVHQFADVDHVGTENLLAFDRRDESLAATAMVAVGSDESDAEVAVIVRSDLQGQGLGSEMLGQACHYAKGRGLRRVHSLEFTDNYHALALCKEMGFAAKPSPDDMGLMILTKDLRG